MVGRLPRSAHHRFAGDRGRHDPGFGIIITRPADHLCFVLAALRAELVIDAVACRPGHPQVLARLPTGQFVVGLSGNPLATFIAFLTLALPAITGLRGRPLPALTPATALPGSPGITRLIPVRVRDGDIAELPHTRSAMLRGMAAVDALAIVAPSGEVRLYPVSDQPVGRLSVRRRIVRISPSRVVRRPDTLAVEEPMELRVNGRALAVTMPTPGADVEFAHEFLLTEGVITATADVLTARYYNSLDATGRNTYNVLDGALAGHVPAPTTSLERNFYSTSSCGVCGKASLQAVRTRTAFPPYADQVTVSPETLATLSDSLRAAQRVFDTTGVLHAAGLFAADGSLLAARKDVGRHNAVDKVLGWAMLAGKMPATGCVLMVSGWASFELVQKAVMAGVSVLAAVRRRRHWPWSLLRRRASPSSAPCAARR